jgi:spore coat protein CotF
LEEEIFSYQKSKDDKVFIYWYNQQVMILKNKMAQKFIRQIEGLDDSEKQLVMAKITGNFKRGNERQKGNR